MDKSLLNDPTTSVDDFIAGFMATHSGLIQLPGHRVVLRKDVHLIKGKVALLSGGGSGHEPAVAGFVGKGMLTGAVIGALFTSPAAMSILAAIKAVNKFQPNGIILIVGNYTGDRLNFGLAMEWAKSENIKVEMVVVGEDCALTSADRSAGRRGLCGIVLVFKIAGALAEEMASITTILDLSKQIVDNMGTISVCLHPCTIPGQEVASFELKPSEMGVGVGAHGEAGVKRVQMASCCATIEMLLDLMTDPQSMSRLPLEANDEVVLLMNNLGGTSNLEMGVLTNEALKALHKRSVHINRTYSGTFLTSLQMVGFSLTVLRLSEIQNREFSLLPLLDMPTDVAASLVNKSYYHPNAPCPNFSELEDTFAAPLSMAIKGPSVSVEKASLIEKCVASCCNELIAIEDKLNEFDRGCGDGDCGSTHARGAKEILQALVGEDFLYPARLLQSIGRLCSENMGGSSGALYSILFTTMARELAMRDKFSTKCLAVALREGVQSLERYGKARVGDRTMLDVLKPISLELVYTTEPDIVVIAKVVSDVAERSALNTVSMKAKAGRASYVNQDQLKDPDPGAIAVATIVTAISKVVLSE